MGKNTNLANDGFESFIFVVNGRGTAWATALVCDNSYIFAFALAVQKTKNTKSAPLFRRFGSFDSRVTIVNLVHI
jgi:hypothetical protein